MWTLGSMTFQGVSGFTAFTSSREANYVQHALVQDRPRLQRVGTNLETISVAVRLHRSFCVPEQVIAQLETSMEERQAEPLTRGDGVYFGRFVVKSYEVNVIQTFSNGSYMMCEVGIELLESLNPGDTPALRATGFAVVGRGAPGQFIKKTTPAVTAAALASEQVQLVTANTERIDAQVSEVVTNPDVQANNFQRALGYLGSANVALDRLNELVNNTQNNIWAVSNQVRSQMSIVQGAASVLENALDTGDVAASAAANISFKATVRDLQRFSVGIARLKALRF